MKLVWMIIWIRAAALVACSSAAYPMSNIEMTPLREDDEISDEKRLTRDLQMKYGRLGKDGRPVKNSSQPMQVLFGLGLIKMELREKENMLSMSTWARYRWKDEYLQWDPEEYGGVNSVKLSHSRIWIPDIMLYNTADTDDSSRTVMLVVGADGTVSWYPHRVYQSSCAVDVRNYPFDNQTCHMWFGSWTHPLSELDLQLAFDEGIDLSTFQSVYKDASEWEIANSTAERLVMPPEGSPQFSILSFTLSLKRKMMFSTYILTMPAIFLSFLTLLVFWLPPEHADKSALGLTIFGSLLLLLLILVEAAPPTASAVPLLGVYYCFTTVIVILSIFLSSLVLKVGRSGPKKKPVPKWADILFLRGLGRILCLRFAFSCNQLRPQDRKTLSSGNCYKRQEQDVDVSEKDHVEMKDTLILRDTYDDPRANGANASALHLLERRLRALHGLLGDVIRKQHSREESQRLDDELDNQWRHLAMVLDRLFFILYLVVIIVSLVLLFPRSPFRIAAI